jgi:uncharacterized protein (TIGR01244 family)
MPSLPPLAELSSGLSAAGALGSADIEALAASGVRTIVNNRPDGEDMGQLPAADARRLAEAHGIAYHHIPVTAASLSRRCRRFRRGAALGPAAGRRALPQRHPLDAALGPDPAR